MTNIYLVGGAVRDHLLNIKSNDLDYVIETQSYDEAKTIINNLGCKIVLESPEYQTIRAIHPILGGVDFALPRSDYDSQSRACKTKIVNNIKEDLARRDFTMNSLAVLVDNNLVPDWSNIIDPFKGFKDIKAKKIRFVSNPTERINEDNLRVLRALRFSITKNFKICSNHKKIVQGTVIGTQVSNDRIMIELNKMFAISNVKTIQCLKEFNQLYLLDRVIIKTTPVYAKNNC